MLISPRCAQRCQRRTNFVEREHVCGSAEQNRLPGHSIDNRCRFILGYRKPAGAPDFKQSRRDKSEPCAHSVPRVSGSLSTAV